MQQCCIYDTLIFGLGGRCFMDVHWVVLPRGDVAAHWSGLYVTLNRTGSIVMSRVTHERLGSPEAFLLMFDQFNRRLGLKPVGMEERNAYPARQYGRRGAKIVRAYRLLTEFALRPPDTLEFVSPEIDRDGNLILHLDKIRVSPKAHSQCRKVNNE